MAYVILGIWFSMQVSSRYSTVLLLLLFVAAMLPSSFFSSMTGLVEYQCCAMAPVICDCQVRVFLNQSNVHVNQATMSSWQL